MILFAKPIWIHCSKLSESFICHGIIPYLHTKLQVFEKEVANGMIQASVGLIDI